MRKTALAMILILALLLSTTAGATLVNLAKANIIIYFPDIVIKSDGSVEPETEFIKQTGNVYSLTANLWKYAIEIQCSNIIFDGAGHIINGTVPYPVGAAQNYGLSLEGVTNVTVRDLEIRGFHDFDVWIENCSACIVLRVKANDGFILDNSSLNVISESNIEGIHAALQPGLFMSSSSSNQFYRNNITDVLLSTSNNNIFFKNNFVINHFLSIGGNNFWDNGSVGNYWSDSLTRYPNVTEIGSTGIGDTPYVINANNTDHYPLMTPVDNVAPSIEFLSPENITYDTGSIPLNFTLNEPASQIMYSLDGEENITIAGNTTLTGLANGGHNLMIYVKDEAGNVGTSQTVRFSVNVPFPTALFITASGASVAAVAVVLLVYFKKHRR